MTTSRAPPASWGAPFHGCRSFAVEHLLLLPLGAAIALVWANTGPESYFRFSLRGCVRRQRRRDGVLLRPDDEGGRRGDGAGRRAASVAARAAAGDRRRSASTLVPALISHASGRPARRADAGAGVAGDLRDRPRGRLLRRAADLRPHHPAIPFLSAAGDRVGCARASWRSALLNPTRDLASGRRRR